MKLKHISLLTFAVAVAVAACSSTDSALATRHASAGAFSSLHVSGSLKVELRQVPDSAGNVIIEATDRAMAHVHVHNSDGTLTVGYDSDKGRANYAREVKRVVAYCDRDMRQITLSGSGMVKSDGLRTAGDITAVVTGSGMVSLDRVDCRNFTGSLAGSGMLALDDIKARNVSTSCSGSGMVKVAGVNAAAFNCTVSGSGMGRVSGSASKISLALRGSGMVDASGLAAQSVNVSCSGSGMVKFDKSAPNVKIVSGRQTSPGIVSR